MTAAIVLAPTDARILTDRIKVGVEAVWELITQAYTQRAWDALGYSSWDDYCTREFGTSRLRLPREERTEVVCSLRESGLSLRAIASATGDSYGTVRNALGSGEQNCSPADPQPSAAAAAAEAPCIHCGEVLPLTKLYEGGQGYECDPCVSPDIPTSLDLDDPRHDDNVVAEPVAAKPITGLDGKSYKPSRPSPKPSQQEKGPRRRPLTDTARELGLDLKSITARMERLLADDRFARNKGEVAPHLRHYLTEAIKVCQDLNDQLT